MPLVGPRPLFPRDTTWLRSPSSLSKPLLMSTMTGPARANAECWVTSSSQRTRKRGRLRDSRSTMLVTVVLGSFFAPSSRAWVPPVSQRQPSSSPRRLRAPSRKGGPQFRRRSRGASHDSTAGWLGLSVAPALDARVSGTNTHTESEEGLGWYVACMQRR